MTESADKSVGTPVTEPAAEPGWYRNFKGITCGTVAGILVTVIGHPFDTLKVRLQTQSHINPTYTGTFDCVAKTIKWEGVSGLYEGVLSPLAGQIFFRTCLFTSYYEALHQILIRKPEGEQIVVKDHFTAGLVSGAFVSLVEGPIDLFKSKMQYQIISEKLNKPLSVKYRGVVHVLDHTIRNYGIRGVYQGLGPTFIRDTLGYSLFFGSYEWFKYLWTPKGTKTENISLSKLAICGGLAGCVFWIVNFNLDVIKSAMMADDIDPSKRKYKNMMDCTSKLYKEGGYGRFWKGFGPCIARGFIVCALMLYVVDVTRKYFPSYNSFKRN